MNIDELLDKRYECQQNIDALVIKISEEKDFLSLQHLKQSLYFEHDDLCKLDLNLRALTAVSI